MNQRRARKRLMAEINVVPYIDVMLVLLVIFMVTVPLLNQGVEVDLPKAGGEAMPPSEVRTLILDVDKRGAYYLHLAGDNPEAMDTEGVQARTAAILSRAPATPIVVRADTSVDYGVVVRAMVVLQKAGAARVGLSTDKPEP
ncbi:MAG: protein TolR [Gammaproteobacteria bacterium]